MAASRTPLRIGIDTGGTFTDAVVVERGRARTLKVPSTPSHPGRAVVVAANRLRGDGRTVDVVHGTTVGLNALLQGRAERTALIVNDGFRDLVEIGRQERPHLYALEPERKAFPVPRSARFTLNVRRDAEGRSLIRLDDEEIGSVAERIGARGIESVAVCLLHATAAPADERRIGRILRRHGLHASLSHEVLARVGEFERATATVWNASLRGLVGDYLKTLGRALQPGLLRLHRNTTGILDQGEATRFPIRSLFSGLAGGLAAASRLGQELDLDRVATLDMGGTSTDVALVSTTRIEPAIEPIDLDGLPFAAPALDLQTIGCGGGSIARCDDGGALRVGPESAGADPGPACYGRSRLPTVTDAHVALGHLGEETLRASGMELDPDRSVDAIHTLARQLECSPRRCAEGILDVADASMARALGRISSERAVDPAGVSLLAFGGAGPLHAARLAYRSGFAEAVIPPTPGVFSAIGLALAPESHEIELPIGRTVDPVDARRGLETLLENGRRLLGGPSATGPRPRIDAVCRYRGQGHGLRLPFARTLARSFETLHQERYGFVGEREVELVSLTFRRVGSAPRWPRFEDPAPSPALASRLPPIGGAPLRRICRSEASRATAPLHGPALIEESTSVTWIPDGFVAITEPAAIRVRRHES
ncbi:MAG: hydantoinase/oxoprolinase family protein [Planctomycetota bacterium]